MTDCNPELVESFFEFSNSQTGLSEEALIVGYTKRLLDSSAVKTTSPLQSFDVGEQVELSKLMVKGI